MKIKNLEFRNPFVLAPLAGITDKSMRSLCAEQGASLVYTEMVSGKGLWYGDRKTGTLLSIGEHEGPVAFQLFGSEPEIMAFAAKELRDRDNVLIDLNVGCPVPKIVKNGEGSALLKKPDVLFDVVSAMVKEAGKPVTAKIRMGFARGENLAVETAKALEAAGAAAVSGPAAREPPPASWRVPREEHRGKQRRKPPRRRAGSAGRRGPAAAGSTRVPAATEQRREQ